MYNAIYLYCLKKKNLSFLIILKFKYYLINLIFNLLLTKTYFKKVTNFIIFSIVR